jgi:hypothetical protein
MLAIGTEPSGLHCSYWWRIHDRDGLYNFLLVRLGAGSVEVTDDGRHTGLVAHGGRQVDGLLGVILGEGLDLSAMAGSALPGQESQGAVTGSLELAVLFECQPYLDQIDTIFWCPVHSSWVAAGWLS